MTTDEKDTVSVPPPSAWALDRAWDAAAIDLPYRPIASTRTQLAIVTMALAIDAARRVGDAEGQATMLTRCLAIVKSEPELPDDKMPTWLEHIDLVAALRIAVVTTKKSIALRIRAAAVGLAARIEDGTDVPPDTKANTSTTGNPTCAFPTGCPRKPLRGLSMCRRHQPYPASGPTRGAR